MKSIIPLEDFLKTIRVFNETYPCCHVGGSLGLFLHGVDLNRPFLNSDIDLTFTTPLPTTFDIENSEESSNPEDFEVQIRIRNPLNSQYIKVDINYNKDSLFDVIEYYGHKYNVSRKEDILLWKQKYANKGVQKHIDDLITIQTGVRPPEAVIQLDDLPF